MEGCDDISEAALAGGPLRRHPAPFALVRLAGPDAGEYLQRLCTQDAVGLAPASVAPAAFLDPKGKLVTTCWIARTGPEEFFLEVQAPAATALLELLDHYHFTEKLEMAATAWACGEWVGAAVPDVAELRPGQCRTIDGGGVALCAARRGVSWIHVFAAASALSGEAWPVPGLAGEPLSEELAEVLRMGAGLVAIGVDTEPSTLALEADLDDHVSLVKGCYTGQEIVARIHTYGHVNRRICRLKIDGGGAIGRGTTLCEPEDGVPVGRVMSATAVPGESFGLAMGYLPKDFWERGTVLALGQASGPRVEVV